MIKISSPLRLVSAVTGLALGALLLAACGVSGAGPGVNAGAANPQQGGQTSNTSFVEAGAGGITGASGPGAGAQTASAYLGGGSSSGQPVGISVSGRGEVSASPDLAILNLGVEASDETVAEARDDAASAMDAVIQILREQEQGIAEEDIRTSHFSISPRYSGREVETCVDVPSEPPQDSSRGSGTSESGASEPVDPPIPTPTPAPAVTLQPDRAESGRECYVEHKQIIVGYRVSNQITVKVRDLDSISSIIDQATDAGGDHIRFQGVEFTLEDTDAVEDQARELAIADLIDKAEQVASLTDVELGNLIYFTETSGPMPVLRAFESRASFDSAASEAATPIMAGELDVVVTVQAVFDIVYPAQ